MSSKAELANTAQKVITTAPLPWKRRVLLNLERAMHLTGAGFVYRQLQQVKGVTILFYHSVAPPEVSRWVDPNCHLSPEIFESHARFLSRHRHVISLDQMLAALEGGQTPSAGTVVLTFDDGYLDNLTVAAPILARYGLPATWYLPTGLIGRGESPWIDRLYSAFRTRSRPQLSLEGLGLGNWDLLEASQQLDAYSQLRERLIEVTWSERESLLGEVIAQLEPTETPPRLILSWEEVRQAVREFPDLEMGVHSVNHLDLSHQNQELVRAEIEGCIADFRRELGQQPRHFAFPYNRSSPQACQMVRALGLKSAMGAGSDLLIGVDSDCFTLMRVEGPPSLTLLKFYTSGAFPGLPKTLLGRAA